MDIIFTSNGAFNAETELFFQRIQKRFPEVKRVHGMSADNVNKIATLIADATEFIVIDGNNNTYTPRTFEDLKEKYPVISKMSITDCYIPFEHKNIPDLVYLTYDENKAEDNFQKLLKKYPKLKRLHRVKGLSRAFRNVADMVESDYYVLIDGDNIVLDDFDLYSIPVPPKNEMFFYMTKNAVNDLVYGYGGIKSCPTENFRRIKDDKIDPIASGGIIKAVGIKEVASITNFNSSPFSAWKAGFREVVMLLNQDDELKMDSEKIKSKINIWKTVGADRPFGKFTMAGAADGENYGLKYKGQHKQLFTINNPDFLKNKFVELGYTQNSTV